jgi:hypothetical protein
MARRQSLQLRRRLVHGCGAADGWIDAARMDDHRGGSLVTGARDHRRGPRRIQIELRQLHQQSIQVTHAAAV